MFNNVRFTLRGVSRLLGVLLLTLMVLSVRLEAQALKAAISGTVTDSSGAAVPNAKITVRNVGTNVAQSITTDNQGRYGVPDLPIGTYEIEAEMTGFKKYIHRGFDLTVGSDVVVDIALGRARLLFAGAQFARLRGDGRERRIPRRNNYRGDRQSCRVRSDS